MGKYKLNFIFRNWIPELAITEPDCVPLYGSALIKAYSPTFNCFSLETVLDAQVNSVTLIVNHSHS